MSAASAAHVADGPGAGSPIVVCSVTVSPSVRDAFASYCAQVEARLAATAAAGGDTGLASALPVSLYIGGEWAMLLKALEDGDAMAAATTDDFGFGIYVSVSPSKAAQVPCTSTRCWFTLPAV